MSPVVRQRTEYEVVCPVCGTKLAIMVEVEHDPKRGTHWQSWCVTHDLPDGSDSCRGLDAWGPEQEDQ